MNAQINHCIAVDARGCGKVDNRTAPSCQAAGFRRPRGTTVLPRRVSQRVKASDRRRQGIGRRIAVQDALKVRGAGDDHGISYPSKRLSGAGHICAGQCAPMSLAVTRRSLEAMATLMVALVPLRRDALDHELQAVGLRDVVRCR